MKKIDTLRAAIVAVLPELAQDPSRLRIWVERGRGQCTQAKAPAFAFAFQLNVLAVEMSQDIVILAHAIFRWLAVNQPERLAPGADGFSFDADILDNGSADVLIQLDLTQNVTVTPQNDGSDLLEYLAEPDPLFDDDLGLTEGPVPPLAAVSVLGEGQVAPDPA